MLRRPAGSNGRFGEDADLPIWAVTRSARDGKGFAPKRTSDLLQRSASARPERPPRSSGANSSDGKPNAGGRKPPEKGNASAGRRRSRRLKRLSMKPGRSMRPRQTPSKPNARRSKRKPTMRRRVGTSRRRSCRPRCDAHATSCELSEEADGVGTCHPGRKSWPLRARGSRSLPARSSGTA